jgi:predicted esterase
MWKQLRAFLRKVVCLVALCCSLSYARSQCTPNFLEKISLPSNQWVGGTFIKGYLRLLPAGYTTDLSKKYPLIIYLPGLGAIGDGSQNELCQVLADVPTSLPNRIETGAFPATVTSGGQPYSFIVLIPQYTEYQSPFFYSDKIDAFIDFALANYRIDPSRIYLTGMSSGANLVVDYIGSSTSHAQRVAAVTMSSLCFQLSFNPAGPANIANAGLPTWFVHCSQDNPCVVSIPDDWVNGINSQPVGVQARYTRLDNYPGTPPFPFTDSLLYCRPFPHDTWTAMYSQTFRPAAGGGTNIYEWFLQSSRAALPVVLKNFSARFAEGKVYLQWTTTSETDNASFTIERAGNDNHFIPLATIPGGGNTSLDKTYQYTDEKPLTQLSYYRLVQTDFNGNKKYSEIRKVVNRFGNQPLIAPASNPFVNDLTVFVTVSRSQKVTIYLTDLNGRKLAAVDGLYTPGTTGIVLPAAHLPQGMYLLKASGESISETYKIIKQ